jgi:hypothetical protein
LEAGEDGSFPILCFLAKETTSHEASSVDVGVSGMVAAMFSVSSPLQKDQKATSKEGTKAQKKDVK